ncbi:antibiotic biosynthesis monooxygenase [Flavipsychrobacter stenotrophus]|uniref:Antibiotic biosynthesis monooxygenase n=1 Tax=Flavipsychrobacter stenotrophus TaxID=2077091 RepID=A0A2S7SXM0_9BACT|nr:antibiotic biosynthesis monooxygenase [Flavipsychrobacter stenotrophus]PQJ11276.1 antibiotic biosynthesis monooxygenase [Flavipsychrobacter stenotrophus]
MIAQTPPPPYYAVVFTSLRSDIDNGYSSMAMYMEELAREQPGFLGVESSRDEAVGITVSYCDSLESIKAWKANMQHTVAQERGRAEWYTGYKTRICKVERDYEF